MKQPLGPLQYRLNYQFLDVQLLKLALTHSSVSAKRNNERLEFLGDSILGLAVSELLYHRYPHLAEGPLSRMRAHLVQKKTLAALARELGVPDCLFLGPGELKSGGFERDSILADALEAIIGAIYLEQGYELTKSFVLTWLDSRLSQLDVSAAPVDAHKDPKTRLQEWLQARKIALPSYQVIRTSGEAHQRTFVVRCELDALGLAYEADGSSRKQAEQSAAGYLLAKVQDLSPHGI